MPSDLIFSLTFDIFVSHGNQLPARGNSCTIAHHRNSNFGRKMYGNFWTDSYWRPESTSNFGSKKKLYERCSAGFQISVHVTRFYFWQEHVWLRPPFTLVPMEHNLNFRRRERPPRRQNAPQNRLGPRSQHSGRVGT